MDMDTPRAMHIHTPCTYISHGHAHTAERCLLPRTTHYHSLTTTAYHSLDHGLSLRPFIAWSRRTARTPHTVLQLLPLPLPLLPLSSPNFASPLRLPSEYSTPTFRIWHTLSLAALPSPLVVVRALRHTNRFEFRAVRPHPPREPAYRAVSRCTHCPPTQPNAAFFRLPPPAHSAGGAAAGRERFNRQFPSLPQGGAI
jgi:hypothetical protein